jgi:N-acetylgalactosamine-N,N'-diacetylbacillosaminyl-diphospho-undecaprenol 4-alpha-N-acetylgalactosaminyltransferase
MDQNNILFIINSLAANGAERVLVKLLEHLPRLNRHLNLSLLVLEEVDNPLKIPQNVVIHSRGISPGRSNISKLAAIPIYATKIKKIVREYNISRVVSFLSRANYVNLLARKLQSPHTAIISERNIPSILYKTLGISDILNRVLKRILYPGAHSIIAISNGVKMDLRNNFSIDEKKIFVIYNPIDIDEIKSKRIEEIENQWLKNNIFLTIITVGRLEKPKNQELLITAFKMVAEKIPNSRLIIIGEGNLRNELKILVSRFRIDDKVEFTGYRQNPFAYMARADLFTLSSDTEGFGNVIIEAMACGCPVISTDCPSGPGEIITSGENGILTEPANMEDLSKAMIKLLQNNTIREKMIKNAYKRAEDFSLNKILKQYYQQICN